MENFDFDALERGHPLDILRMENAEIGRMAAELQEELGGDVPPELIAGKLGKLTAIRSHYGKTEQLLMPLLYRYGVTGPSQAIWAANDEVKRELGNLAKSLARDKGKLSRLRKRIGQVLTRIQEGICKEEKVIFPMAMRFFTEEDWFAVYRDFPEFGYAFLEGMVDVPSWASGEAWLARQGQGREEWLEGKVHLPTGELTLRQLRGIFSLLPVDITFIDKDNILRFFVNEGRVFARPLSALGRDVFLCHPPELQTMLRQMLEDFRTKRATRREIFKRVGGRRVGVVYHAVYDSGGEYLGTVEFVQDLEPVFRKFPEQ